MSIFMYNKTTYTFIYISTADVKSVLYKLPFSLLHKWCRKADHVDSRGPPDLLFRSDFLFVPSAGK